MSSQVSVKKPSSLLQSNVLKNHPNEENNAHLSKIVSDLYLPRARRQAKIYTDAEANAVRREIAAALQQNRLHDS